MNNENDDTEGEDDWRAFREEAQHLVFQDLERRGLLPFAADSVECLTLMAILADLRNMR